MSKNTHIAMVTHWGMMMCNIGGGSRTHKIHEVTCIHCLDMLYNAHFDDATKFKILKQIETEKYKQDFEKVINE